MVIKLMLIGTIPVIIFVVLISLIKLDFGNAIILIGWTTLLFGVLLGLSDFKKITKKEINLKDAFLIGIFQALAIIPGVSRSGAVITAGRFLGYSLTSNALIEIQWYLFDILQFLSISRSDFDIFWNFFRSFSKKFLTKPLFLGEKIPTVARPTVA